MGAHPHPTLGFLVILAIVVAVFCIWYFSAEKRRKRAIRAVPRTPIAKAQPGKVARLTGCVSYLTEPVRAPLTGRACAYYQVTVDERRPTGNGGAAWVTIVRDAAGVDFLIEDGTGRARVVVDQALRVAAVQDAKYASGPFNDATPHLEAYLAKHGLRSKAWILNKTIRYQEAVFEAGETVTLVGMVAFEHDPGAAPAGAGYRETPQRAVIAAPPGGHLLASDDPAVVA
jgi:hypothetical protein